MKKGYCKSREFVVIYLKGRHPGVAQFGSVLEWGSRGRWFKSSRSDHEKSAFVDFDESGFFELNCFFQL